MREDLYDQMFKQEEYYWWHVGKRKLVLKMLEKFFSKEKIKLPVKILDVGCGTGKMMQELSSYGKIWGLDIQDKALRYCRAKKAGDFLLKADLRQKLPLKKHFFDAVLCLDVLEHIQNEEFVLSEFFRILKKDGVLILTLPAYQFLWGYWDRMAGHHRRYDTKRLEKILKQNGFKVEKLSYYYLFALLPTVIFRLVKSHFSLAVENCSSDFVILPVWLNDFLLFLAKIERCLFSVINLPAGLSLFCLARKEKAQ